MRSLKDVIGTLEKLFDKFNDDIYQGELEKPIISVSPDTTSGAYGWVTSWKAWDNYGQGRYEINLCAEHLNRPFAEICVTLLHEMVHLYNLQHEIKDTSRGGKYHNMKFKKEAEKRLLNVDKDSKYGFCHTSLNEDGVAYIESLDAVNFPLYRIPPTKVASGSRKSSSRKYVCPTCGLSIRATKDVNIMCGDCEEHMIKEQ